MEIKTQSNLDSIRPQEQNYEQQIRHTYKGHQPLFVNHSSDLLHLQLANKEAEGLTYQTLIAKTGYDKYDCIAEVRGSVIRFDKLRRLIENGSVSKSRLPLLLYLNAETKFLLSPKNISKYLFSNPQYRKNIGRYEDNEWARRGNCYVENHYGFKLFVTASRQIQQGQQLVLEQRNYDNLVYTYNNLQF